MKRKIKTFTQFMKESAWVEFANTAIKINDTFTTGIERKRKGEGKFEFYSVLYKKNKPWSKMMLSQGGEEPSDKDIKQHKDMAEKLKQGKKPNEVGYI